MKVQKRSLVMNAVQVNWKNWNELADLLGNVLNKDNQARRTDDCVDDCGESGPYIAVDVPTLNGVIEAIHGEWVLKDGLGQFWVMDPQEFAAAYDPEVTQAILDDSQVPDDISVETTREELEAVAEHQRCMDQRWPGRYEKLTGPDWIDKDEELDIADEPGG